MNSLKKITLKLPWLNEIPSNWEIKRGKLLFKKIQRDFDDKAEVVTAFRDGQVTLRKNRRLEGFTESIKEIGYQGVQKGDLVIHSMDGFAGAIGVSDSNGKSTPVYIVCIPQLNVNPFFYAFLLRHLALSKYIQSLAKGIRERSTDFRYTDFGNLILPLPPRSEQDAIVKFLDEKVADINMYISTKHKLIELLKEQKSSIINKAVTKGIGPNIKLKDSDDKYIGAIPKSWEVRKLKFLSEVIFSNVDKHSLEEEQKIYLCNYVDVYKNDFINSSIDFMKASASELEIEKFSIKMDDIIITKDSETYEDIAKPAIVIETLKDVICGYHLAIIRCKSELIIPRFLFYLFKSVDFNKQFAIRANGITRYGLSQLTIKDAKVLIPSLIEQKGIVSLIEEKSRSIDQRISSLQHQIDLINEYKNSLIAEAVTGELKLTANIYEIRTPKNPYFARTVMAAEIINELYKEPTFGRVKLVKLIFLAERLSKLDLGTNYHRQAAGPYDSQAIRSIEKQLKEHSWFKTIKKDKGKGYKPLEKVNEYHSWFDKYYLNEKHIIHSIINTFRTAKTIQCEIVATLYSAWEDLTKINSNITDDEIVNEVLNNWHESKKRIPKERWLKALNWMKVKNIVPIKQ